METPTNHEKSKVPSLRSLVTPALLAVLVAGGTCTAQQVIIEQIQLKSPSQLREATCEKAAGVISQPLLPVLHSLCKS